MKYLTNYNSNQSMFSYSKNTMRTIVITINSVIIITRLMMYVKVIHRVKNRKCG